MVEPGATGRCLCGAVRYEVASKPVWTAMCHCESCRRAASAPVVAWMGFRSEDVTWSGNREMYRSSEHALRSFCPVCGTQMSFQSAHRPEEIDLYAVSLDDPNQYAADFHCYTAEHLDWLKIDDDLLKYRGSAHEARDI